MKYCKRCSECIASCVCGIGIRPGDNECETYTKMAIEGIFPSASTNTEHPDRPDDMIGPSEQQIASLGM